jgi:uncharacterized protein YceK
MAMLCSRFFCVTLQNCLKGCASLLGWLVQHKRAGQTGYQGARAGVALARWRQLHSAYNAGAADAFLLPAGYAPAKEGGRQSCGLQDANSTHDTQQGCIRPGC